MLLIINTRGWDTFSESDTYYVLDTDDLIINSITGSKILDAMNNLGIEFINLFYDKDEDKYIFDENVSWLEDLTPIECLGGTFKVDEDLNIEINGKKFEWNITKTIEKSKESKRKYKVYHAKLNDVEICSSQYMDIDEELDYIDCYFSFSIYYAFRLGNYIIVSYGVNCNSDNLDNLYIVFSLNGDVVDAFTYRLKDIEDLVLNDKFTASSTIATKYITLVQWRF